VRCRGQKKTQKNNERSCTKRHPQTLNAHALVRQTDRRTDGRGLCNTALTLRRAKLFLLSVPQQATYLNIPVFLIVCFFVPPSYTGTHTAQNLHTNTHTAQNTHTHTHMHTMGSEKTPEKKKSKRYLLLRSSSGASSSSSFVATSPSSGGSKASTSGRGSLSVYAADPPSTSHHLRKRGHHSTKPRSASYSSQGVYGLSGAGAAAAGETSNAYGNMGVVPVRVYASELGRVPEGTFWTCHLVPNTTAEHLLEKIGIRVNLEPGELALFSRSPPPELHSTLSV
jgi:hypothetical protein